MTCFGKTVNCKHQATSWEARLAASRACCCACSYAGGDANIKQDVMCDPAV